MLRRHYLVDLLHLCWCCGNCISVSVTTERSENWRIQIKAGFVKNMIIVLSYFPFHRRRKVTRDWFRSLEHWNRKLESHYRHGCLFAFVLSSVVTGVRRPCGGSVQRGLLHVCIRLQFWSGTGQGAQDLKRRWNKRRNRLYCTPGLLFPILQPTSLS